MCQFLINAFLLPTNLMISNVAEYCSPSEYVKNQEMQGKISSGQIISQLIAQNKKTRIKFAKGSLCGFYSGNISQGKEFVLKLADGQLFTSKNTGQGSIHHIYVIGPKGRITPRREATNTLSYYIPVSGDYSVYLRSVSSYTNVEFCAY